MADSAGITRALETDWGKTSKTPISIFCTALVVVQTSLVNAAVSTHPRPTITHVTTHSVAAIGFITHVGAPSRCTLWTGLLLIVCIHRMHAVKGLVCWKSVITGSYSSSLHHVLDFCNAHGEHIELLGCRVVCSHHSGITQGFGCFNDGVGFRTHGKIFNSPATNLVCILVIKLLN